MITTKTLKIEIPENLSSHYIEQQLKMKGYDVLRWAITGYEENNYILDVAVVEE